MSALSWRMLIACQICAFWYSFAAAGMTEKQWEGKVSKVEEKWDETPFDHRTQSQSKFFLPPNPNKPDPSTLYATKPDVSVAINSVKTAGSKPNILVFMADDLGYYDVGYADDARNDAIRATPYLTKLAGEGIRLTRHYGHWHCSPSRRSFLSGRLPIHAGGDDLTNFNHDDMDVRFTWISEKLKKAGYYNLYYGKGHTGAKSVHMLPRHRGFDYHLGFLGGSQPYRYRSFHPKGRWWNGKPSKAASYSTKLWGNSMYSRLRSHLRSRKKKQPVFLFYSMQVPHSPLQKPDRKYKRPKGMGIMDWMMLAADQEIQKTVKLFRRKKATWENTLILFVSDNGGTQRNNEGSNYPLRGEKGTSFEGAFRVTGFVSGGIVPAPLRGTDNRKISHISDWYRTFCNLAGVDATDDPPEPPQYQGYNSDNIEDPQFPNILPQGATEKTNLYGPNSFPPVDSKDLWPVLMNPSNYEIDTLHPYLVLSGEVILKGDHKLIIAQPCSSGITKQKPCKTDSNYGWINRNRYTWDGNNDVFPCMGIWDARLGSDSMRFKPCLFDVTNDIREKQLINNEGISNDLWKLLNDTLVYQYTSRLAGKEDGLSPAACHGICKTPSAATRFYRVKENIAVPYCDIGRKTYKERC